MRAEVSQVVTYRRVSTSEQGDSGAGLEAQANKLTHEIAARGWTQVADRVDVASGSSTTGRPELADALRMVRDGEAGTIMVAKLDRLCRSMYDFVTLAADAGKRGWNLVSLDLGIDLSTPTGMLIANIMAAVADWERQIIAARTSDALRAVQAGGTRLGRPPEVGEDVVRAILALRALDWSYRRIGAELARTEKATAHGGVKWWPATVRAVEMSQFAADLRGEA